MLQNTPLMKSRTRPLMMKMSRNPFRRSYIPAQVTHTSPSSINTADKIQSHTSRARLCISSLWPAEIQMIDINNDDDDDEDL